MRHVRSSTALASSGRLLPAASLAQTIHLLVSSFLRPSVCPRIIVFSKERSFLMMRPKESSFGFVSLAAGDVSGFLCSGPLLGLSGVHGAHRAVLQQCI